MNIRLFFAICAVFAASMVVPGRGDAQQGTFAIDALIRDVSEAFERYEAQLNAVLKTRLIEERDFVEQVVDLMQDKKLPKQLVDSAWLWVRNNRPYSSHPFIYFERILRLQAEGQDIELPEFDRSIYSQTFGRSFRQSQQQRFRR